MSVSSISDKNRFLLWVLAGGRCQYRGCNEPIYKDIVTKRNFNSAYIAHIVADVPKGPRGCPKRSPLLGDDINNLMLLCDTHHRLVDKDDVDGHTEDLLVAMKKEHEDRIERVTGIASNMQSHILTYRANVGVNTREVSYQTVSQYLLPEFYPAEAETIDLSLSNSVERDKDDSFWTSEVTNLEKQFDRKLHRGFAKGDIKHLSIFAFAPIPLLIKLGTLINNIYVANIFQPVKNPNTWKLTNDASAVTFKVIHPLQKHKCVALNISLSATINNERITKVLGEQCSIYTITIENPFNDFLKSKKELEAFSIEMTKLFNLIKADYNEKTPLHIFPAMPVSTAIELGRVWMPKADMPLKIYDQNTAAEGFKKVLEIFNQ